MKNRTCEEEVNIINDKDKDKDINNNTIVQKFIEQIKSFENVFSGSTN